VPFVLPSPDYPRQNDPITMNMSNINQDTNMDIYICIGNTGTGKSTFVKSLGGDVSSSELMDSGRSLTTEAKFYKLRHDPKVLLVDTPGFRDSRSSNREWAFSDSEHMKEILNAFVRKGATHINGVYWFVNDPRLNDELRAQARFIDALVNPEIQNTALDRTLGWKHVVVLLRGNSSRGRAVRDVVEEVTGDAAVATSLQFKIVGLQLDREDPGHCDLEIRGRTLQDLQTYEIAGLQEPVLSRVLRNWFHDMGAIEVCGSDIENGNVFADPVCSG
jgi:GTP-binding protein EngB required for normal cell division